MKIQNHQRVYKVTHMPFKPIFSILVLIIPIINSCKKYLEIPPPTTQLVTDSVFNNGASATSAQLAIYAMMVNDDESSSISYENGLLSDELTNYNTNPNYLSYYINAMAANNPSVGAFGRWNDAYSFIYQANAVIRGLQNSSGVNGSIKQQLIGEAKVTRAFWHFYLTNCYGDVPLALTTDYTVTSKLSRTPRIQVLQQVIADLTDAQNSLNNNYVDASDTASTTERVRPNKAVATALLARAYLYLGDYNNKDVTAYKHAEDQATIVINNPNYSLISPLTSTNYGFTTNNSEAIWQLYTPLPTSDGATSDGDGYVLISAPGTVSLSNQLLNAFEPGDNRRNIWVGSYTTTDGSNITYYFPYKYKTTSQTNGSNVTEYITVLRLAEQYLIRAEARAEQGNIPGAQADLNVIRNRAGLPNTTANDKASLLAAILHERQVELFTEWGHRWFDLNRTGNTNAVMSVVTPLKGGIWSPDGHQELYPIPQPERSLDPNLSQNPGY